jgi:hypothetical protein
MSERYKPNDRIMPSDSYPFPKDGGLKAKPRTKGHVIGVHRNGCVRVKWDGIATLETLHPNFIAHAVSS